MNQDRPKFDAGRLGESSQRGQSYTMRSPVFGPCILIPQTEPPGQEYEIGYVSLEGRKNFVVAIWRNGEWRDRNLRRFPSAVLGWHAIARIDGSPLIAGDSTDG